jgi:dihydrofolate reductase
MGKVLYSMQLSLDGYVEDAEGGFDFATPAEDVHRAANEQAREASAFLFGRRMYEIMEEPWTTAAQRDDLPPAEAEFARLYVETPRYVFSDTLSDVPDGVTLVRRADAVAQVTRLKRETDGYLDVGGPTLAASLLDLIDEIRLYVMPVTVGGGKPFIPPGAHLRLRLVEQRTFPSGVAFLRYEVVRSD